jgi:hypothetical protein
MNRKPTDGEGEEQSVITEAYRPGAYAGGLHMQIIGAPRNTNVLCWLLYAFR